MQTEQTHAREYVTKPEVEGLPFLARATAAEHSISTGVQQLAWSENLQEKALTIAPAQFLYSSWCRVPQGTAATLKFSSPIILQNPNYHSTQREKIQWANWFFWWPHELLVLHLTGCWVPSHGFQCGFTAWSSTEVPLPTWEPCYLHHTGSLHRSLFSSGGSWGSVMLCSYLSGAAIDLHEQSPAQQLTISQKNVVDYSCTE